MKARSLLEVRDGLKLPSGAGAGKVLTSDASGNASWQVGSGGAQLRNGTGAPTAGTGNDGDFYIDVATNTLYGPKASGAWPSTGVRLSRGGLADQFCRAHRTTAVSIPDSSWTVVPLYAEVADADPGGWHSTASNTQRITVPQDGFYRLTGHGVFATNGTGYRGLAINAYNAAGVPIPGPGVVGPWSSPIAGGLVSATGTVWLPAGGYVEMYALQTSGASLNFSDAALTVERLRQGTDERPLSLEMSKTQTLVTGTGTTLSFTAEAFDDEDLHSTSVNTSRITAKRAGVYIATAQIDFATHATGLRGANFVHKNSAGATLATRGNSLINASQMGVTTNIPLAATFRMAVGDYLELAAVQNSGGNLDVTAVVNVTRLHAPNTDADVPIVTSLPAMPGHGQTVSWKVTSGGQTVMWRMKYDANDNYWYFEGGSALRNRAAGGSTQSGTYNAAGTQPSITLPATPGLGDWDVTLTSEVYQSGSPGQIYVYQSYAVGAAAASDTDAVKSAMNQVTGSVTRTSRKPGVASGAVIAGRVRAQVNASVWAYGIDPELEVVPHRILAS